MKRSVYISSTLDLAVYRDAIETTFRKQDKFFDVAHIAEYMTPASDSALKECLKVVETCDLYVLIIGRRYGSIDPTSGLSYTHREYKRAIEESVPSKEILVFYAADNATGLVEEKDNPEKFREFKTHVLYTHTANLKGFTSPEELILQLQDALLIRILENLPVIRNEAIEYKCNRNEYVNTYKGEVLATNMRGGNIISAILYGTNSDKPKSFTERLVKLEFQLPLKLLLTKSLLIDSMVPEKCMLNLVRNIYEQLFPEDKNYYRDRELVRQFADTQTFFALLQGRGIRELFIEFIIDMDDHDLESELLLTTLKNFITSLAANLPASFFVHNAFSVISTKNFSLVKDAYKAFKEHFTGMVDINYLKKITRKDIANWMEAELKIDIPRKIDYNVDKYFGQGNFEITLSDAQEKLQKMVNEMYFNIKQ